MSSSSSSELTIETVQTKPFSGQKPGTSGLRKRVSEVKQPHYLENFVHCVFAALPANELKGSTLVVSGDGRYYNDHAVSLIIRMSAAVGVGRIIMGQKALVSTPCVSAMIRGEKAYGGIILTASHNPGGPDADFGIKYNCSNGGPAPESLTDKMFELTKNIAEYRIAKETPKFDAHAIGESKFGPLTISVIDATDYYSRLMQSIFDFDLLRKFVSRSDFSLIYDTMHGVAGPFAHHIFINDLKAKAGCIMNEKPLEDFGGGHPDPNLTYAEDLVAKMGLAEHSGLSHGHGGGHGDGHGGGHGGSHGHAHSAHVTGGDAAHIPDFGAASDGDADRNMILGRKFFVTPSDSVAIIAANAKAIPYFVKRPLTGVARSMPTSAALDRVASKQNIPLYEVPTGWKFFGNLMDADKLQICGEESFGTGSDHIREKDGMWAILAWLSILAYKNKDTKEGSLVGVQAIVEDHWKTYGRNYYSRYDYESVDSAAADKVMAELLKLVDSAKSSKPTWGEYTVATADEFTYKDPVDHSVSAHQGIRFIFSDGSRIVYRLSGTGSVGATIRVYIERYEQQELHLQTAAALEPLIKIALDISKMKELTGRDKPTVIT